MSKREESIRIYEDDDGVCIAIPNQYEEKIIHITPYNEVTTDDGSTWKEYLDASEHQNVDWSIPICNLSELRELILAVYADQIKKKQEAK